MGTVLDSWDNVLASCATNGPLVRFFADGLAVSTAATTGSGYVTGGRFPRTITVPSMGAGLTGVYFTGVRLMANQANVTLMAGLEYELGSLAVDTNTFTSGVSMPTKTDPGNTAATVTTATQQAYLVATAALTATTPTITITYTNQAGTPNRTATLTLPTSPTVNTAFAIHPHLQSGDTGIRAVTNISRSAGTVGTLRVMGVLPIGVSTQGGTHWTGPDPVAIPVPLWKAEANDRIAFYRFGSTIGIDIWAVLSGVADN